MTNFKMADKKFTKIRKRNYTGRTFELNQKNMQQLQEDIECLISEVESERARTEKLVKALERIEYEDSYGGVNQYPSASVRARQALEEYKGDE
jgi:paraquat-inducible protein B